MIKFNGSISEDNKKIIIKKERIILFLAILISDIIGFCFTIFLAIKIHLIYLLFLIPLLFLLIIPFFPLSKKTLNVMIPIKISINNDLIISEGNNFKCIKYISDIKKIIDYGTYYFIYFKWPKKSYRFLCQKNLISEGTLKNFETIFQNKIKQKNIN